VEPIVAYIPPSAKWHLAEIVEEITIEGEPCNVVHLNTTLVRADSPEEAYERAQELGRQSETTYRNLSNNQVAIHFRGLHSLDVIYDDLEHGAELSYTEHIGVPKEEVARLITAKEELRLFRPTTPSRAPDYKCKEVAEEALRMIGRPDSK
jgi:hypothetical protein